MRRAQINSASQPVRNLAGNPALNYASVTTQNIRTNLAQYPNLDYAGAVQNTRTNLLTNPSFETNGSTNNTIRTNLALNPAMAGGTGTSVVRTNLCTNPRGISTFLHYSGAGAQTITPNVSITGGPEGLTTATRFTYDGSSSNPGLNIFSPISASTTYTLSAWFYIESLTSTTGNGGFAENGVISGTSINVALVGQWQKITWTRTTTASPGPNFGARMASVGGTGTGSILVTGIVIEASPAGSSTFFDGATAASGDFTYSWTGTANASTSTQNIPALSNYNASAQSPIGKSLDWAAGGTTSLRIIPMTSSKDTYAAVSGVTLVTGKTYTISAVCRLAAAQTGTPDPKARRIYVFHSSVTPGATFAQSAQAANAAGSTTLSTTFTVTDDTQYQSIRLYNGSAAGEGEVYWDNVLIEEADTARAYFDGSSTPAQDVTHVWSGTANASSSLLQVTRPSGVSFNGGRAAQMSTEWSARGTKSLKVIHAQTASASGTDQFAEIQGMVTGGTLLANTTYTISGTCRTNQVLGGTLFSAAMKFRVNVGGVELTITDVKTKPNTAGASRVVGRFTTTTNTSITFLRVYAGASYGNGDVWWDELCLEQGVTDGTYFDGVTSSTENLLTNPSFDTNTTGWNGAGNNPGVLTRVTSQSHSGSACVQVAVDGTFAMQGAFTVASNRPSIKPHMTYTAVAWVKGDAGKRFAIECGELDSSGALIGRTQSAAVTATGNWQKITSTRSMGVSAVFGDLVVRNVDAVAHTFYVDSAMYVQTDTSPTVYYSGNGDFTYAWTGTADQSTSVQKANLLGGWSAASNATAYQSSLMPMHGTKCAAVVTQGLIGDGVYHNDVVTTPGMSYTLSSWIRFDGTIPSAFSAYMRWKDSGGAILLDNIVAASSTLVVGDWVRVSATTVAPANAVKLQPMWRVNGSHTPTKFYVDSMQVEQSNVMTPFFDGTTAASGDFTYVWSGTANQSISYERTFTVPATIAGKSTGAGFEDSKFSVYASTAEDGSKTVKWVSPAGTPNSSWRLAGFTGNSPYGFSPTIKAGGTYTLLVYWRGSGWGSTSGFQFQVADQTGQNIVTPYDSLTLLNTNTWNVYRRTFTALRDATTSTAIYAALPLTPQTATDGIFEIKKWMLVEGTYTGDYIDGNTPLSKWDGTVNASTSVGYPPQLLDLAGAPISDFSTTGTFTLPGGFGDTEARTIYTVYNNLLDITDTTVPTILTYGSSALSDAVPNTFITLRQQAWTGNVNFLLARRTGGQGAGTTSSFLGVNVAAWGLNTSGYIFNCLNNGAVVTDNLAMTLPNDKISIWAPTSWGSHVRTIIYRGYHDAATRQAVSRYLGNKYGAVVA